MYEFAAIASAIAVVICSLIILLNNQRRYQIISLAIQYLGVFGLSVLILPWGLAIIKLIVGWMVCSVLAAARPLDFSSGFETIKGGEETPERLFRTLSASIIWVIVFASTPIVETWLPIGTVVLWGGLLLIGMGMLQLGMSTQEDRLIIGLLTVLSGFEILYGAVEASVLVTGLLAMVNLGISLIGAYWLTPPVETEEAL